MKKPLLAIVFATLAYAAYHRSETDTIPSGQTLLVAHNIDVAPRIANMASGDTVELNGEYEWNEKGGVIHGTQKDPANQHVAGWLKHGGQVFQ